jgi:hypothetical protein
VIYQKKKLPLLLFGNKLDLCGKGEGREVSNEVETVMKGVEGFAWEGSGFVGQSF